MELFSEDTPGKTYADVLARPDIAAVLIALPIANQSAFIEAALKAGKHVLSEKPVGPDVEGAKKVIAAYREQQQQQQAGKGSGGSLVWSVAEQFRFLPKYVWAAEHARTLGKVIGFHFRIFQLCKQGQ